MVDSGVQSGGYFVSPSKHHTTKEVTRTRAITINALAEQLEINPTHIKIDVEGAEEEVLLGGENVLQKCGPLLFLELHNRIVTDQGKDPAQVLTFLNELGYELLGTDGTPIDESRILEWPLIRIMARKSV
jgi:hypothetical protein